MLHKYYVARLFHFLCSNRIALEFLRLYKCMFFTILKIFEINSLLKCSIRIFKSEIPAKMKFYNLSVIMQGRI